MVYVLRVDTANRDTAVAGAVDAELLGETVDLLRGQSSVAEHTDLGGDVVPVALRAKLLQFVLEEAAHGDHAVGHLLDLTEPLGAQLGVIQDLAGDAGAIDGRVGVQGTDDELELGLDAGLLLGVFGDEREHTGTLTVEAHIFSERLAEGDLHAGLNKQSHGVGIPVAVTRSKALVGHVEEREQSTLLDDLANLLPLLVGGVDTGGVVSTGVQQDGGAWLGGLEIGDQAVKVEANVLGIVIAVLGGLNAGSSEHCLVVCPSGSGKEDLLGREELGEELSSDPQRTSTGDGLGGGDAALLERSGVLSISEGDSCLNKGGNTSDSGVFLVQFFGSDLLFGLTNRFQHVRLAIVVAVGTHPEVDLVRRLILLEGLGDTENSIWGTLRDVSPGRSQASGHADREWHRAKKSTLHDEGRVRPW